jgi:pyruvate dehydrogenase E2 component (dihydrolipoamide acetyltransferase)
MPRTIVLPELAESVVEGEIQRWLVAVGDVVAADQPLVEVMTDKATVELPSPFPGVVHRLLAAEGAVVKVHAPIAVLLDLGEAPPVEAAGAPPEPAPSHQGSLFRPTEDRTEVRNPFLARRARATPKARKIARERGIDLGQVTGSGPHGRIRVADVESAAGRRQAGPAPLGYRPLAGYEDREERIPIRGVRRAIAEQMTLSHLHTVRTLAVDEADLTALRALRDRLRPELEAAGARLTYLPFVCRAVAIALERFPALNGSIDEASQEVVLKRYCHLGLAVATDGGLMVPVARDVDRKSVAALAGEIGDLAARGRSGRLRPEELTGSTFTITSIGNTGTLFTFPIINLPNAGILGFHSSKRRPVVVVEDGREAIAIREMVYLSLSFDHRLVDGATAAAFLRTVIESIEEPETLVGVPPV